MSQDTIDLVSLLKDQRRPVIKRYEMSKSTFQQIVFQMQDNLVPLTPEERLATSLWGLPIHFDNALPLGEIKPIYA